MSTVATPIRKTSTFGAKRRLFDASPFLESSQKKRKKSDYGRVRTRISHRKQKDAEKSEEHAEKCWFSSKVYRDDVSENQKAVQREKSHICNKEYRQLKKEEAKRTSQSRENNQSQDEERKKKREPQTHGNDPKSSVMENNRSHRRHTKAALSAKGKIKKSVPMAENSESIFPSKVKKSTAAISQPALRTEGLPEDVPSTATAPLQCMSAIARRKAYSRLTTKNVC